MYITHNNFIYKVPTYSAEPSGSLVIVKLQLPGSCGKLLFKHNICEVTQGYINMEWKGCKSSVWFHGEHYRRQICNKFAAADFPVETGKRKEKSE